MAMIAGLMLNAGCSLALARGPDPWPRCLHGPTFTCRLLCVYRCPEVRALVAGLLVLLSGGCAHRSAVPLDGDVRLPGRLRARAGGGPHEPLLVYRSPTADWPAYDKVLLEPVTLWRSGRKSLDPVPQEDLLRLVADFQSALRTRLGEGFRFVDQAGPGVMRIRLAMTEAHASDSVLDCLRAARGTGRPHPAGDGPLDPEMRRFLESAMIEGEFRDATDQRAAGRGDRSAPVRNPPFGSGSRERDRFGALRRLRICQDRRPSVRW